jgi:hypothetical protein
MTLTPAALFRWLDDRVNPIVVKEARQAVRSAAVVAGISVTLTILLLVSAAVIIYDSASASSARGAELFAILNACVLVLCLLFVPIYTAVRLAGERSGNSADLLYVTTISPASIVWGKLVVAMMIATLFFSVAAPFLVLTYLFRGIDLPTIVFVIVAEGFLVLVAAQAGVFIASLPISGLLRGILMLILAPLALWMILALLFGLGVGSVSVTMMNASDAWGLGAMLLIFLMITGLLFVLSVAACSPPPSNRARLVRVYMLVCWAVSLGLVLYLDRSLMWPDARHMWYGIWTLLTSCAILISSAERREIGPRLRARLPRSLTGRIVAFFFTSGAVPGITWGFGLALLTSAAMLFLLDSRLFPMFGGSTLAHSGVTFPTLISLVICELAIPLWALTFSLLAVLIRDRLLRHIAPISATVPIAIALASVSALVPPLIAFLVAPNDWDRQDRVLLGNIVGPWLVSSVSSARAEMLAVAATAALLMIAASSGWILSGIAQFARPRQSPPVPAPATAKVPDAAA